MFYAAVIPENSENDVIDNARITAACETSFLLRNNEVKDGKQVITYGKWLAKEKLSLVAIVDPTKTYSVKFLNEMVDEYNQNLNLAEASLRNDTIKCVQFLCKEFSKPIIENADHEYMISAIFSENVCKMGFDGVLYPSYRAGLDGLCIAIKEEAMTKIKLEKVLQTIATKKDGQVLIDNTHFCEVELDAETFELKKL